MQYAVSLSEDYATNKVVIRDFKTNPPGRVLCIIARDNRHEAEQIAQKICDLLNTESTPNDELGTL
jgi:hypothetical protein